MLIQEPVQASIWHCLNHYAYGDATFLAERLLEEVPTDESLHLLSTCYYRSGSPLLAYDLLRERGAKTPQNKFLLAKCAADLRKLSEAETLLRIHAENTQDPRRDPSCEEITRELGDSAAFGLQLLASIYGQTERTKKAVECDRKALKLNPFLWKSYEALCNRGDFPEPSQIFNLSHLENMAQCHGVNTILNIANNAQLAQQQQQPAPTSNSNLSSNSPTNHSSSLPPAAPPVTLGLPIPNLANSATSTPLSGGNVSMGVANTPTIDVTPTHHGGATPMDTQENTPRNVVTTPFNLSNTSLISSSTGPAAALPPTTPYNLNNISLNSSTGFHLPPVRSGVGIHSNLQRRERGTNAANSTVMSGIGALNFSSDSNLSGLSSMPRNNHLLNAPPFRKNRIRQFNAAPVLTTSIATPPPTSQSQPLGGVGPQELTTPAGNIISELTGGDESIDTPTFGLLQPRGATHTWRLPNQGCALRLDFSSPSLSVLSPFLPSANSGSCVVATTPGGIGGNEKEKEKQESIKEENNQNESPALNPEKAALTRKRIIMASKDNPLKSSNNSNNITPSPGSNHPRRSSRLFGSTQSSVKENSKAPTKKPRAPKSPSRKSKPPRIALTMNMQSDLDEKNEKNKVEKEKSLQEKIESSPIGDDLVKPASTATTATTVIIAPVVVAAVPVKPVNLTAQALAIQKQSSEGLMQLMRSLGTAYAKVASFNSKEALKEFENIPLNHKNSAWCLGLVGKAHFELGDYKQARTYFKHMRGRCPYRLDFTEYYSTALWHLQDDVELSALAQELTAIDKHNSPQAWCAAGNCFSHLKEHENAIKFFQRAVQVDPSFAYAHTLLGHEYVMIEELEKALTCFRTAVRMDPRHYNAWYGIGLTYYKQERFQLTEIYYRKALGLNPYNPILMCHVAVVQHSMMKTDRALETLNAALRMSPKNSLCKFERASILFSVERYEEALDELNQLKELVPKESPVYFLLGKVHNKLNNTHLALMHFSWAMDLDPKGANSTIKDALDPSLNRAAQEEAASGAEVDPAAGTSGVARVEQDNSRNPNTSGDDEEMMQMGSQDDDDLTDSFHPAGGASTSHESLADTSANVSPEEPKRQPTPSTSAVASSSSSSSSSQRGLPSTPNKSLSQFADSADDSRLEIEVTPPPTTRSTSQHPPPIVSGAAAAAARQQQQRMEEEDSEDLNNSSIMESDDSL